MKQTVVSKPPALCPGDTIGIMTPSSPAPIKFPDRFQHAVAQLETLGFQVKLGPCAAMSQGYRSASPQARAAEINAFVHDAEVSCIISAIGGLNSNALLPFLDWAALRQHPKIFVGHSDVTALLLAIYAQTGLVTFYGPAVVPTFGEWPTVQPFTSELFQDVLMRGRAGELPVPAMWTEEMLNWADGTWKTRPRRMQPNHGWRCVRPGTARGPLIGGNLNTMSGFIGTPWFPDVSDAILFVEDSLKGLGQIDRLLTMLRLHGVFDCIAGLVVGKPELLDTENAPFGLDDLVLEVTAGYTFPIISNVDLGHTAPMLTLPIGVQASLDAAAGQLVLHESGVQL